MIRSLPWLALVLFVLVPSAEARLAAVFLGAATLSGDLTVLVTRRMITAALLSLFALNYLTLPYWSLRGCLASDIPVVAGCFAAFGWSLHDRGGDQVVWRTKLSAGSLRMFAALLAGAVLLNAMPLYSGIPFKGDMQHHIVTLQRFSRSCGALLVIAVLLGGLSLAYIQRGTVRWLVAIGGLAFVGGVFLVMGSPGEFGYLHRYPSLYLFIHAFISFPPVAQPGTGLLYQEGLFRLPAILAFVFSAWVTLASLSHFSTGVRWLVGIAFLSLPIVHYYSTLMYIEPLMVALGLVAIMRFEGDFRDYMHNGQMGPGYVALLVLSFLKETSVVFCLSALGAALVQLVTRRVSWSSPRILRWTASVFLPAMIFLFLRDSDARPVAIEFHRLLDPGLLGVLVRSVFEQFATLVAAGLVSAVLVLRYRRFGLATFVGLVALGSFALQLLDGDYVGYSRFNLPVVTALAALTGAAFESARVSNSGLSLLAGAVVGFNLVLSPVDLLTGHRKPGWGDYVTLTSEFDTPYPELFRWLRDERVSDVCVVGRSFGFIDHFYARKYRLSFQRWDAPVGPLPEDFFENHHRWCVLHRNLYYERVGLVGSDPIVLPASYGHVRSFKRGAILLELYRLASSSG